MNPILTILVAVLVGYVVGQNFPTLLPRVPLRG